MIRTGDQVQMFPTRCLRRDGRLVCALLFVMASVRLQASDGPSIAWGILTLRLPEERSGPVYLNHARNAAVNMFMPLSTRMLHVVGLKALSPWQRS